MSFYNAIIEKIRNIQMEIEENEAVTNLSASATLTSEITVISAVLIAVVMLRKINFILMLLVLLVLGFVILSSLPLSVKLRREQGDEFSRMIFYVLLTLGVVISAFYWGVNNV